MDYEEFGTVEQFLPNRILIKPTKPGLLLDVVLFDKYGTFIGQVIETSDEHLGLQYSVLVDKDSLVMTKSIKLKLCDPVYYYNCDKLITDAHAIQDELSLLEKKVALREHRSKGKTRVGKQVMRGVIHNLRDLRLDSHLDAREKCIEEEEQKSTSKNTQSIASIVLKSYCNRKVVGNQMEKQKAKRYKKIKARILGDLCQLKEEKQATNERIVEQIEDELQLGKRKTQTKMVKLDSLVNNSTDYSKNSYDADRNSSFNGERFTSSDKSSSKLIQEQFLNFTSSNTDDTHRFFTQ